MSKPRQSIRTVPIQHLTAHPANVRDDLGDLTEMALSIQEHGILQPLTATEGTDGKLLLLAGHRRLAAACLAKLDTVPVIIRHNITDPTEHLVVMLVENTQRRDLNAVERAEAYGALRNQGLTLTDIARRTGTKVSTVSYYLNLLALDDTEREEVRTGAWASTEAIAHVRETRQTERAQQGKALRGRPKTNKYGAWFNPDHRLAATVRQLCRHRGAPKIGGTGCGPCWELAIISEAESDGRLLRALRDGEAS